MADVINLARHRQHAAVAAIEATLQRLIHNLFPETRQAARVPTIPPPQIVRPDKSETPAVAAAGVPEVPTPDRSTAMQTLPQPRDAVIKPNKLLAEVGTAQHAALIRWFARGPLGFVYDSLEANPAFPLVKCSEHPRHFAPARGTPQPAA